MPAPAPARKSLALGTAPPAPRPRRPSDDTPRCSCRAGYSRPATPSGGPFRGSTSGASAPCRLRRRRRFAGWNRRPAFAGSPQRRRSGFRCAASCAPPRRAAYVYTPCPRCGVPAAWPCALSPDCPRSSWLEVLRFQSARARQRRRGRLRQNRKNRFSWAAEWGPPTISSFPCRHPEACAKRSQAPACGIFRAGRNRRACRVSRRLGERQSRKVSAWTAARTAPRPRSITMPVVWP